MVGYVGILKYADTSARAGRRMDCPRLGVGTREFKNLVMSKEHQHLHLGLL